MKRVEVKLVSLGQIQWDIKIKARTKNANLNIKYNNNNDNNNSNDNRAGEPSIPQVLGQNYNKRKPQQ